MLPMPVTLFFSNLAIDTKVKNVTIIAKWISVKFIFKFPVLLKIKKNR